MTGNVDEIVCRRIASFALVPAESIELQWSLTDDLGLDSVDAIDLLIALEGDLGVELSDEQLSEIRTVQDVLTHLERGR